MATPTYTAIASITLGSSASSVTFSSIPQDYRDLVLVASNIVTAGNAASKLYFNSDSTDANYSNVRMQGSGSGTFSGSGSGSGFLVTNSTTQADAILQVMDYSATDKHKTVILRDNENSVEVAASATRWANTSAITALEVLSSSTFNSGCVFSLWGIAS